MWAGGQNERMNPEANKWRKAVFERDKFYCRRCHSRRKLEAHHIYPFGQYPERRWDLANGVTLCRECHRKFRHHEIEYAEILSLIASTPLEVWNADALEAGDPAAPS